MATEGCRFAGFRHTSGTAKLFIANFNADVVAGDLIKTKGVGQWRAITLRVFPIVRRGCRT